MAATPTLGRRFRSRTPLAVEPIPEPTPNARSLCLAVAPGYNEAGTMEGVVGALRSDTPAAMSRLTDRSKVLSQRQPILEQGRSEVEHARAVAAGDEARTFEPLLRGDD
jgi:hypothetical protein